MRYELRFHIFDTEQDARSFCDKQNSSGTNYNRRRYPAHYTEYAGYWTSETPAYIAWFYD